MPLILPGNVASATAGAFEVANSCRFNNGDSAYLSKTLVTPTNAKICTFSTWYKQGTLTGDDALLSADTDSNERHEFKVWNHALRTFGKEGGSTNVNLGTSAVYRDPSAWYHIVLAIDTSQSTDTNRIKIYVNGTQVTSFQASYSTYIAEDAVFEWCVADAEIMIGASQAGNYLDGYLAEVCFIDGQQLAPTSFGEFNEDSPTIWQPIDVSGLTFGNNGFYLDFEDSANLGNDANGGTDLSETNIVAADQSTDTPTNNFCTLNSLQVTSEKTFSQGNTTFAKSGSWHRGALGTIAPTNGKWYVEFKNNNDAKFEVAVCNETLASNGLYFSDTAANSTYTFRYSNHAITFYTSNGSGYMYQNGSSTRSDVGQIASGDIGMIAFDCTTGKLWTGREGTWDNSGDPAAGSDPTTTWSTNFTANQTTYFGFAQESDQVVDVNFGGVAGFGGTAVSSANADGNGYGAFEFSVPSGFYALCTKNLAEFG